MAATDLRPRRPIAHLSRSAADPLTHVDWVLLGILGALSAFGLLSIYGARYQTLVSQGEDPYSFVKKQVLALAVGGTLMLALMFFDYRRLRELTWFLYAGTSAALLLLIPYSRAVNGTSAWFNLGPVQLQPAEFAKVTLITTLAAVAAGGPRSTGPIPLRRFVACLAVLAVPGALTLIQPDLGTTLCYVAITMGVLLVGGGKPKHIVAVTIVGLLMATAIVGSGKLHGYQQDRLTSFVADNRTTTDANLQLRNSETAIGLGGLTGSGFKDGKMTNGGFVPVAESDFIFTTIAEQFGFVGASALLLLYGFLAVRLLRVAQMSGDMFGSLIATGALAYLVFQVFENVGMTMGIMPITGLPLPLVSYGGSSTVAFLALMGVVQNIHMRRYV